MSKKVGSVLSISGNAVWSGNTSLMNYKQDTMKFDELIHGLETIEVIGSASADITSLTYDSRKVTAGSLFIAVKGYTLDGAQFIQEAVANGAAAVLTESLGAEKAAVIVRVPDARKAMAVVAERFYGSPQNALVMTAVTGTNGKTTTSYMIKSIFDAVGMSCGLIGTINHIVAGETIQSLNTTPEAPDIYSFLARMVSARQTACVMEVSSHALALSRTYGMEFRAAAYLNLSHDHLDFHGDLKNYLDAKSVLFTQLSGDSTAVINRDDLYADHIISVSRGANILTFGESEGCEIRPLSVDLQTDGSLVTLSTPAGEMEFSLSIPGRYNVWNAMAATGIGFACGVPMEVIVRGLETVQTVRGRYEIVDEGQEFTVIVDYAHTPDALERILLSARELTKGRLVSVFGCGGDRDRGKRPLMGEISARLADFTVITSDNPRTENPLDIISDIINGISSDTSHEVLPDREEAIRRALVYARPGDTVVIAGKGHEDYQVIGTERRHFDDAETARRILRTII